MYETTIVAIAIVVITLVIAWYFQLFSTDEDDLAFGGDEDISMEDLQKKMRALTPEEADNYGGTTEHYRWEQNNNEVTLFVPIDEGISKKHIKWDLEIKKISLEIDGKRIIDGVPYRKVLVEDSLWSFDEDEKTGERLFVWTLVKLTPTEGRKHWKCVAHGEPEIDTMRFGSAIQTLDSNNPDSIKAMVNSLKDSNDEDS